MFKTIAVIALIVAFVAAQTLDPALQGSYSGTINLASFVPVLSQVGVFQGAFTCGTYNVTTQGSFCSL